MKTTLNKRISISIKDCLASKIEQCEPRLNYEITDFNVNEMLLFVSGLVAQWRVQHFFCISNKEKLSIKIVDKDSIESVLLSNEPDSVLSVVNPTTMSGITYDFSVNEEPSFLVTCWGEYEGIAKELMNKFPGGVLFDGN